MFFRVEEKHLVAGLVEIRPGKQDRTADSAAVVVKSVLRFRNAILVIEECVGVQSCSPTVSRHGAVEMARAAIRRDQYMAPGAGTEVGVQRIDLHLYCFDRVRVDQETGEISVTAGSAGIIADYAI